MKKLLLLVTVALTVNLNAQPNQKEKLNVKELTSNGYKKYDNSHEVQSFSGNLVAVRSLKTDTLFLLNDTMGKNIKEIWDMDKKTKNKPVLIFVDAKTLAIKQEAYNKLTASK